MTRRGVGLVGLVLALALGFVAGLRLASSGSPSAPSQVIPTIEAVSGNVAQTVPGTASVTWEVAAEVDVPAPGRLTSDLPGDGTVESGSSVFEVDELPTVAIAGEVPAYREMRRGDVGRDIRQLQRYLKSKGYSVAASGTFDARTADAVRAWSARAGWPAAASVPLGRVVFLPRLPAQVAAAAGFRVGAPVPSPTFLVLAGSPTVRVNVTPQSAEQASRGDDVELLFDGATVSGDLTGEATPNQDGSVSLHVDPSSVDCAKACPPSKATTYTVPAEVELVPPTEGIVVPVAALSVTADGESAVTLADGTRREVRVVASADGMAVVAGLRSGERVRLGT